MEETSKIIYSLHRPLSEPIWICKWVCQFINGKECPKNITLLSIRFYEFLVNKLASLYGNRKLSLLIQKGILQERTKLMVICCTTSKNDFLYTHNNRITFNFIRKKRQKISIL